MSPKLVGAWCSCSECRDDSRKPAGGFRTGFDAMTSPVETLQRLYRLDVDPFPIDGVRIALERASKQAPDDDRVWLGRAHLAICQGEFAEAEGWLERCLDRGPTIQSVWRMKLECALAAGDASQVRQALTAPTCRA